MQPRNFSPTTRRLVRNVKWLSINEVLVRVIGLASAIYLARVLSPSAYGALGLALAIVGILTTLVQAGSGSRATRLTAMDPGSVPDTYAQITALRLVVSVILITLLLLNAPLLSSVFSFSAGLLMLCSLLLLRPALTVVWAFRGLDQMQVNAKAEIAEKTLVFLGLVLLVKGQGNDLLWAPALEVAAALIVVWWLRKTLKGLYPQLKITFACRDWPVVLRESVPLGVAALLGSVYLHGAILLLGWLQTPAAAADFLVAQKVMLTVAVFIQVVNKAAFPSTSRLLSNDRREALALQSRLIRYYLLIIMPAVPVLGCYASGILGLLFGDAYANSGQVMMILLAALPFLVINHSLMLLLRALPRPGAVLGGRTLSALVLLLLAALLIPGFGASGAAFAVVASEFAAMILLFWLVRRSMGAIPWEKRCWVPVIAGPVAGLVIVLTFSWPFMTGVFVALLLYFLIAWLFGGISTEEVRSLPQLLLASSGNAKTRNISRSGEKQR